MLPGDLLKVSCDEDPSFDLELLVRDDGTVFVPTVGCFGVATLTPRQIAEKLDRLSSIYGLGLPALIMHSEFLRGAPIQVQGAVTHPFSMRFVQPVGLKAVLDIAAPNLQADLSEVEVSHADGTVESVPIASSTGSTRFLKDGDRVTVLFSTDGHTVEVVGGVATPSHLILSGPMTLIDAVTAAGGIAPRGVAERINVARKGESIPVALPDDGQFRLQPGDVVHVGVNENLKHVLVLGGVIRPGLIDLVPGLTLSKAIAMAGGVEPSNHSDLVWLKQNMQGKPHQVKLSLRTLASHDPSDPILNEDDVVQVGNTSPAKSSKSHPKTALQQSSRYLGGALPVGVVH